ncbi:hypothetical protein [Nostoc sp. TCL240-02]|uniref:hypothetical protein n=1 Tax=Nostoc sp. TCL240-02 TaxID=2572090 RepID=UPI00157FAFC8|nr:hypothetical protein [Nostoc sp. TCL240-02]QKQ73130.1 hypothetical protein FBB35_06805 [Nostoc sp. TCL240-02]
MPTLSQNRLTLRPISAFSQNCDGTSARRRRSHKNNKSRLKQIVEFADSDFQGGIIPVEIHHSRNRS